MNSRLRWRSLTSAWTLPVSRSIPANSHGVCTHDPARSSHGGLALAANPVPSWRWPGFQASRRKRRSRPACSISPPWQRLFQDLDLAVDTQNFRHLGLELGVAAFQIVAHLVRLDFLLTEKLAHCALSQTGETLVTRRRSALARMAGQKP